MENVCAILFTLVLLLPLILQLQLLIADPKKLCTIFHYYATNSPEDVHKISSPILQRYPNGPTVFKATSSDATFPLTNLRTVFSSPVVPNSLSIPEQTAGMTAKSNPIQTSVANANDSCTFVATNQVPPVVDIACDYNTYRYKTFEASLRSYYGDKYPPGDVVLNSMQLNLLDSHTNVPLRMTGLFDFVEEKGEPRLNTVPRMLEIDYLDPLDHFVTKQLDLPTTEERFTETDGRERCRDAMSGQKEDPIGPVITTDQEKHQPYRRSSRKIETPCKYYLSPSGRVCRTNDSRSRRKLPVGERGRCQTAVGLLWDRLGGLV